MEFTPRGGGNRLAEMLDIAANAHLIENAVKAAVGDSIIPMSMPEYDGHIAEIILHADNDGIFERLEIADDKRPLVIETDLWVKNGDNVNGFTGANNAIGTLVLRFPTREALEQAMISINDWCKIIIK